MIKLIVFDMAGTVINENNVVYKTLHKAIANAGVEVSFDQVLAEGAGKEKSKAIKDIVSKYSSGYSESAVNEMYKQFVEMLEKVYEHLDISPIDGAEEVFRYLRENGIRVVLNTGYKRETANQLISKLQWKREFTFDELVTASDVEHARPQPDMIFLAMKLCGITSAQHVVKVGDSIVDIEEGKNANCGIIVGITTGAHTRAQIESANPNYIIDNLSELVNLVARTNISAASTF